MFGGLCFLLHGHMVCGVHKGGAMFRPGKPREAQALDLGAASLSFTGRPTGGMVEHDEDAFTDDTLPSKKKAYPMLILHCPCCGVDADETELSPGGEAHLTRHGPGSSDEEFESYLFNRANPRGVHFERWRHAMGCGKWFHAARATDTLEVFGTYSAQTTAPPESILRAIRDKRPGWQWKDPT